MKIKQYQKWVGLKRIHVIDIQNELGFSITFTDIGAGIYQVSYPNLEGKVEAVTVTPKSWKDYCKSGACYGKVVGRVAGRIAHGTFEIDGKTYHTTLNDHGHTLHGGSDNTAYHRWTYEILEEVGKVRVIFHTKSKHGKAGFPGNVKYTAEYTIRDDIMGFDLLLKAMCDQTTPINLTNHIYLNLSERKENVLNHVMTLHASKVSQMDPNLIIQQFVPVSDLFDFRKGKKIGEQIDSPILQNHQANGYDHVFYFDDADDLSILKAEVYCPSSKRYCHIFTNNPCMIVYPGNYPSLRPLLSGGIEEKYFGLTVETMLPLDHIENTYLSSEQTYSRRTYYRFGSK